MLINDRFASFYYRYSFPGVVHSRDLMVALVVTAGQQPVKWLQIKGLQKMSFFRVTDDFSCTSVLILYI